MSEVPSSQPAAQLPSVAAWSGLIFAVLLWLGDSALEYLWFQTDQGLSACLLPLQDPHELLNRGLYACAMIVGGLAVAAVLRSLLAAQAAEARSAENLRVTLASIGDAVIATDCAGRVTRMNAAASGLTGWEEAAALGQPLTAVFRIINTTTRQPADDPVQRVLATGRIVGLANHTALIHRDGSERQIADSAAPIRDTQGAVIGVVLVFRDVTREYALQEQVRRNEEDLRVTLDSIGDAVIATDTAGRITRMNPVAERLTGWPLGEASGQPLLQVFRIVNAHSRQLVEDPAAKVLATGEIVGLANHTVLLARDGKEYQIADSGAPIRSPSGGIRGVVLVFRDVTGEYALQEQVRQSQKMDAIGQLAGGIAHDFNNMLGGIMGAADLLGHRLGADERAMRHVTIIQEASTRAAGLTGKLLAFARRQPLAHVPVDAHQAVQSAVAILRSTIDRRITITVELAPGPAIVLGDLAQLEGVFLNLGINAAHAMPEGGRLSFRSRRADGPITITVEDTGCGIPPEQLPRIFEPFFTTKGPGKGTGLGLSASLGTIQQCDGRIEVASTVGVGSTFQVILPASGQQPGPEAPPAIIRRGTGLILVVDDESAMRSVCREQLESLGYHIIEAEHGAAALDLVRNLGQDIDLVILDMVMPVMSGRDCFVHLQRIRPGLRVLLASGYSHIEDLEELRRQGLAGVIAKPFRMAELSQAVVEACQQTRHGQTDTQPEGTPRDGTS